MKEYQAILDKYSFSLYSIGSKLKEGEWGNKEKAIEYLKKYYLPDIVYHERWKEIQNSIFYLDRQLPDMIFKKKFEFISLLGGVVFEQKDFEKLKTCLQAIGERNFLIVKDTPELELQQTNSILKMKYPPSIGWDELMSGNFLSAALFEFSGNNYYIFGTSGKWGMYAANDYLDRSVNSAGTPINIIGFDPTYKDTFREAFEIPAGEYCENVEYISEEERPNLKEWVPKAYRNKNER